MPSKEQIIEAIQIHADASGYLDLRASLGDPSLGPIVIRHEAVATGQAYKVPGFTDSLLYGVAIASGIYGEDYRAAASLARVTDITGFFVPVLTLDTPKLTGTYEIVWRAVVDSPTVTTGQVLLFNVTDNTVVGSYIEHSPSKATDLLPVGGSAGVVFTGESKQFRIQHRDKNGVGMHGIQDMRITLKRVA